MHCGDIEQKHDRDAIIYVGGGILRLDTITGGDRDPQVWKDNGDLLPAEDYDEIVIEDKGSYTEITAVSAFPRVDFETAGSEGLESVSPAYLAVTLSQPVAETVTVDYGITGGTATPGVDYWLSGTGTLTFDPCETTGSIGINIVDDGANENDETIIVELSNPSGPGVLLGSQSQHTYAILDPRAGVGFDTPASSGLESLTLVTIPVSLSATVGNPVTVNYAATGGTAAGGGADYTLLGDGTLQFDPGEMTEHIYIAIVDDSIEEVPDETIELTLSNPSSGVKLAIQNQHTYTIIDNEEGIRWDGLTWYYSESPSRLTVNQDGQLMWTPEGGDQFITRLPEHRLSQAGDIVELTYWWMTDGDHDCPDCFDCDLYCHDDDITCIAGTSDMRAGLFEADGEYITADGFDVSGSSVFAGYKGYAFRFGPNMRSGPTRWVDCTNEVHKTGNFQKKAESLDNLMYTNDGLEDYIPGFELPPGEWSLWTISLERLSSSSVRTSITLNDRTYTWTDTDDDDQPQKIDVFAVHMRNHRPYSILALEPLSPPPPPGPASNLKPTDGAEGVAYNVILSWTPGTDMLSHDVYLGTNSDDVNTANIFSDEFKGRQSPDANVYNPCGLELGMTYYWRIDEVNNGSTWRSDVLSFTVADYVAVDDMESYNNDTNQIIDTWKVYPYPDTNNGAYVYLEQAVIHGADKSMEFYFDSWWGNYFKAIRTYPAAQNWAVRGANHLSLWYHGYQFNSADDQMYVAVKDGSDHSTAVTYDGDPNDIRIEEWQEWNIPLQDLSDGNVNLTDVREVVIGANSLMWYGTIYYDDIRLYPTRCMPENISVADLSGDCVVDIRDFVILANQWRQSPGSPSADVAPDPPDGFVEWRDLAILTDYWLEVTLWPAEE
jgi:hypothetical protein